MGMLYLVSIAILAFWGVLMVKAEDPYRFYKWNVTYGIVSPLGTSIQVIMINGQFPGPPIECNTNDNINISVINNLDEPFLLTWNGIKQRKSCWQDGVLGTNCPILPGKNFTYKFQTKDQIGSYTYFPTTGVQRAVGGFGPLNVMHRAMIPVPYPMPFSNISLLIGDWYNKNHTVLQRILDSGKALPAPTAILINGQPGYTFNGESGKTYMLRVSNIGLSTHINFRIQGHKLKLVEVEGSHTVPNMFNSLDIYVGQSMAFLVTFDQPSNVSYHIVASSTFKKGPILNVTGVLRYGNSIANASGLIPPGPNGDLSWSINQARSIRWNLMANAARPNPQGSFHYGTANITKTITLQNSPSVVGGKQRYAVNNRSYINPATPLKLADHFNISNVFYLDFPENASLAGNYTIGTHVIPTQLHDFIEIIFQNNGDAVEMWHLDGYDFWVVGMGLGKWTSGSRNGGDGYNLHDAVTRHTVQVYPKCWSAIYVSLDNEGMWNLRSAMWARQYLGQQLYIRVLNPEPKSKIPANKITENPMPQNVILCGLAENKTITTIGF
ncbi:l-ascorbate oxidase homolog [Phtheirospermum japonicum]|uniref:L-ascorbate oxidase homolog n=1 Tax=Phtheirospermum japonicum TaxID=374723 RepID=A0A830D1A3_9LAMI|nr:l-ascorbate oxidase homolog [Phtheirospermum japonicum]